MPLEFGNDICTPCEPSARIWHNGNDPIGRRPIAMIVDDLQPIQHHQPTINDTLSKGVAECGKETNTRFFFFRGLLDTPPPSTFLIYYVFPRIMSFFFFFLIQKIYV